MIEPGIYKLNHGIGYYLFELNRSNILYVEANIKLFKIN